MKEENLKNFILEEKADFIVYLKDIIMTTYKYLKDFKRYINDLDQIIEHRDLRNNKTKRIPEALYTDIRNQMSGVEFYLLNIVGDLTSTAISYNKFRKLADKRQSKDNILGLDVLDQEIIISINQVNMARNWSLHIPESLLTAQIQIRKKTIEKRPEYMSAPNNPIRIIQFAEYEGEWLISLYEEKSNTYDILSKIFQQMKKDYSKLLGESVTIETRPIGFRPLRDIDVPKVSFEIQQRKFKGVDDDIFIY